MAADIRIPKIEAIVNIDGKEVNFVRLRISQEMGEHHDFEVMVDFETFDEAFHESPDIFMQKTNTKVVIDLQHADKPETAYVFSGMVTNIRMIAEDGMHGGILFIGKSNTIELERGEMMQTYSNTNLIEMLKTVTGGTMNLDTDVDPAWKADVDFAIQHRESDWRFLQRICNQYKERMYYTGTDLIIGPHPEFPTVNLTYDMELSSFEMCSRLVPNQFSTYYYKREEDKNWEQDSPGSIEDATSLLDIVSGRSDNLTISRKPNAPTPAYVPDMDSLIEHTKRRKVTEGAKMMYAKGSCKVCDVRIGRIISVQMPENMGGADLGKYRVYNIVHEFDQNGRYKCDFEAIPADLKYIPIANVPIPVPNPIEVKVWDNEDPEGMGRIRVTFPFDERDCEAWIPVMTFDAGSDAKGSGNVKTNRGTVVLPEISDSCILSFLDGQELAHPFIMGSIFHGKNADNQGGGPGNHIKTFTDKAGTYWKHNTDEGSYEVYSLKGDSLFNIDGQGNATLRVPKTITLIATDINLNASNSINFTAKPGEEGGGEGFITAYAEKNIDVNAETDNISVQAKSKEISLKAKTDFKASSEDADMKLQAAKTVQTEGKDIKVNGSSTIRISSKDTDII